MIHTVTTRKGSTYTIDTDRRTFIRSGAGHPDVTGLVVEYRSLTVSADPRQGIRFQLGEERWLRTSAIEEGHHELYWGEYHRDPDENDSGAN